MNNYYVYMHTRLSDGKLFYVGKGKGNRAFTKKGRNQHWHRIVQKDGGFTTLIYADNLPEHKAFELEQWLIKLAGRNTLTNMTDGGDAPPSQKGIKRTEETKQKISLARRKSQESKKTNEDCGFRDRYR